MKALDLCCGLGGWSKGLAAAGFEITGVDIIDVGYPFEFIEADINQLNTDSLGYFDVIVGSPPCRDFSKAGNFGKARWKDPPDIERGLKLVDAFLRIVEELKPSIWLMENSYRLAPILEERTGKTPLMTADLAPHMRRAFWGDYPLFLITKDMTRPHSTRINGKYRSWRRAEIPLPIAAEFARVSRVHIEKTKNKLDPAGVNK